MNFAATIFLLMGLQLWRTEACPLYCYLDALSETRVFFIKFSCDTCILQDMKLLWLGRQIIDNKMAWILKGIVGSKRVHGWFTYCLIYSGVCLLFCSFNARLKLNFQSWSFQHSFFFWGWDSQSFIFQKQAANYTKR